MEELKYYIGGCGAKFTQQQNLHRHRLSCVEKKVFTCDTCSSTFNRKDSLIRHQDKCKGDLICKLCDIGYRHFSNLKRHIERYHAGQNVGEDITVQSC